MDNKSCVHDLSTINNLFVLPAQGGFPNEEVRQAIVANERFHAAVQPTACLVHQAINKRY